MPTDSPMSITELYHATQEVAAQHPTMVFLGQLNQRQPKSLTQPPRKAFSFYIALGDPFYGTDIAIRENLPHKNLRINISESSKPPLKDALGRGVTPALIFRVIAALCKDIQKAPSAKEILEVYAKLKRSNPKDRGLVTA